MFHSYVVYDTIEIEPVYFPATLAAATAEHDTPAATSSTEGEDGLASPHARVQSPMIQTPPLLQHRTTHSNSNRSSSSSARYAMSMPDLLVHRLTERYVGKVLPRCGLCLAVADVLEYTHSVIRGPAGSAWLAVTFLVCVFAPLPGSRLRAQIDTQTEHGMYLLLDFFSAFPFFVPAQKLVPGSCFDPELRLWYLPLSSEEEQNEEEREAVHQEELARGGGGASTVASTREGRSRNGSNSICAGGGVGDSSRGPSNGCNLDRTGRSASSDGAGGEDTAGADNSARRNYYVYGEEVVVKVVQCTVRDGDGDCATNTTGERGFSSPDSACGGCNTDSVFPPDPKNGFHLMEIIGSFDNDCLGPTAWFE